MNRDIYIDRLRGFAIFTMVFANMSPLLTSAHPFWMRACGSFAAPVFFTLIGMMVAYTMIKKSYEWKHFVIRAVLILLVAVFVDMAVYSISPFTSVDVLYMLSISLFIAGLCRKLSTKTIFILILLILVATPILQKVLGYTTYPTEIYLDGSDAPIIKGQTSILNHWIIDGWFPLFPWVAFSLIGLILARLRWRNGEITSFFLSSKPLIIGLVMLILGAIVWYINPGPLYEREGFSELFFPATIGYLITGAGVLLCLFYVVATKKCHRMWDILQLLGETSLFMYILHNAIIWKIMIGKHETEKMSTFLLYFVLLTAVMIIVGFLLRKIKEKYKKIPYAIKFIIGT